MKIWQYLVVASVLTRSVVLRLAADICVQFSRRFTVPIAVTST